MILEEIKKKRKANTYQIYTKNENSSIINKR